MTATTTPAGTPGVLLTCTDSGHWHYGKSAIIRSGGPAIDAETACGNITLAHHPVLSRAASIRRNGPWAVSE